MVSSVRLKSKTVYERLRDKEFAIHVCAEHPKAKERAQMAK